MTALQGKRLKLWALWFSMLVAAQTACWLSVLMAHRGRTEVIESRDVKGGVRAIEGMLAELTEDADRLFEEKKYMTPEDRNAWRLYRSILQIDPDHEEATSGIKTIAHAYVEWGEGAFGRGEYEKARENYEKAEMVAPGSRTALKAKESLEKLDRLVFTLSQGKDYLEARNYQSAIASFRHALELDPGHKEAASLLARTQKEEESIVERTVGFIKFKNGTVLDTRTGLMWAAKDNGKDIDWSNAKRYCENLTLGGHRDWRLPTIDELESLHKEKAAIFLAEKKGIIRLTNCCPWSSETKWGVSVAYSFDFLYSELSSFRIPHSGGNRALPVRIGK